MATFENLRIRRLIVHEVVLASALNNNQQPVMSQSLTLLDPAGLLLVARRLAEALGTESHSIDVKIKDTAPGSTFQLAASLLSVTDADFISTSQQLAMKLSRAQTIGSIKSGVAVVIDATVGPDAVPRRLSVIVKAESDSAFVKKNLNQGVTLEFVKEMVFGAQQRLFKVGAFLENPEPSVPVEAHDFEVVVYDHQMNIKGEGSAAQYFYSTFLGASMTASVPQINKKFFESTVSFINSSTRNREEKWALRGDLISYFRSTAGTISPKEFAESYFPDATEKRNYYSYLKSAGVPNRATQKDSRFIMGQLKQRRLSFSNRVNLSAPADDFEKRVQIIDTNAQMTTLRIAGALIDES